jgi:hypothetical protein
MVVRMRSGEVHDGAIVSGQISGIAMAKTEVAEPVYAKRPDLLERRVRQGQKTPLNTVKPRRISSDVLALVLALISRIRRKLRKIEVVPAGRIELPTKGL